MAQLRRALADGVMVVVVVGRRDVLKVKVDVGVGESHVRGRVVMRRGCVKLRGCRRVVVLRGCVMVRRGCVVMWRGCVMLRGCVILRGCRGVVVLGRRVVVWRGRVVMWRGRVVMWRGCVMLRGCRRVVVLGGVRVCEKGGFGGLWREGRGRGWHRGVLTERLVRHLGRHGDGRVGVAKGGALVASDACLQPRDVGLLSTENVGVSLRPRPTSDTKYCSIWCQKWDVAE